MSQSILRGKSQGCAAPHRCAIPATKAHRKWQLRDCVFSLGCRTTLLYYSLSGNESNGCDQGFYIQSGRHEIQPPYICYLTVYVSRIERSEVSPFFSRVRASSQYRRLLLLSIHSIDSYTIGTLFCISFIERLQIPCSPTPLRHFMTMISAL